MFEATGWPPEGWCNAAQSCRLILPTTAGSPQMGVHQHTKRRRGIEPRPYKHTTAQHKDVGDRSEGTTT